MNKISHLLLTTTIIYPDADKYIIDIPAITPKITFVHISVPWTNPPPVLFAADVRPESMDPTIKNIPMIIQNNTYS
jgi:hypothetical protein